MSCSCDNEPCDCACDPCFANDATGPKHCPKFSTGRFENQPKTIITANDDLTLDDAADQQVDITAPNVTVTLPRRPQPGDTVTITANAGSVLVQGGCKPICGTTTTVTISSCRSALFTYTTACKWVTSSTPSFPDT